VRDILDLVHSLGGLHDAMVFSFTWVPGSAEIALTVEDIYANFLDLPEYKGPLPGTFKFFGVTQFNTDIELTDQKTRIFDWLVTVIPGGYRSEILFWPSGRLIVECTSIVQE
jgi:hypothetical protein